MNALTTPSPSPSNGSRLTTELAKMLGLVAPVTMSADQCTIWLASAEEALTGITPAEVEAVSFEVRRSVTRHTQIVPEISRLVHERRSRDASLRKALAPNSEFVCLPGQKKHIMDRDRRDFTAADWRELNDHLASVGSPVRYQDDGTRYRIDEAA